MNLNSSWKTMEIVESQSVNEGINDIKKFSNST